MRRLALCVVLVSAFSCSDSGPDGTEIGAAGGDVVSDDGSLTLTIPAGALTETVRIRITSVGAEASDVNFDHATTLAAYEFSPSGLHFAIPAVVRTVLPNVAITEGANTRIPFIVATTSGEGVAEINPRQELAIDL